MTRSRWLLVCLVFALAVSSTGFAANKPKPTGTLQDLLGK